MEPIAYPRIRPRIDAPSGLGDEGIVGNWLMYYLKGGNHLHDFSPEDNHGTINGAKWKDGRYGWALDFDGVDDDVNVGDPASLSALDPFTMSAWVYFRDAPSNDPCIIGKGKIGVSCEFLWMVDSDTNIHRAQVGQDSTDTVYTINGNTALTKNAWNHVVLVYDGANNLAQLWLNGVIDKEDTSATDITVEDTSYDLLIGKRTDETLDAIISEVRIYSVAKSSSWIKRRFERTKGIFGL